MPIRLSNIVFPWLPLATNNKLRKFLPWARLRSLSNSTAVKLTIFIPLLGYMVLFNSYVVDYLALTRHLSLSGNAAEAISWRIILIYFGLVFLAIASTIYQLFCPVEIKQFATSADYIAATWPHMGDIMRGRLENDLKQNPNSSEEFSVIQTAFKDRSIHYMSAEQAIRDKMEDQFYRDILELNFRTKNEAWPPARFLSLSFYVLGFLSLTIPSVNVFYRVLAVAASRFL